MCLKTLFVSLAALLCVATASARSEFCPVKWKKIQSIAQKDPGRIEALAERMTASRPDTTLTMPDRILAFFGQSYLTEDREDPLVREMQKSYQEGCYAEALAKADEVLEINPLNLEALFKAAMSIALMRHHGDETYSQSDGQAYFNRGYFLLETIAATGDGSEEHPFCVTKVSDEYNFMYFYFNLERILSQALVGHCDVFELGEGNEKYSAPKIYFDVTRVLEIEIAMYQ